MRKQDLIRAVAKKTSRPENQVGQVVDTLFDVMQDALADGDEVAISGFGSFRVVDRPARKGRNPQTREEITIGPRRTPAFRAGASLKRAVGDHSNDDE